MAKKDINLESMLRTETVLHDNYRIVSYLSSGGFGNTYVATHIGFNVKRAIKEFFLKDVTERGSDGNFVKVSNPGKVADFRTHLRKFKKEAERLYNLRNEHIVRVYDLFDANGTAYYVMDYIDGENLAERLENRGGPIPEKEVVDILRQVLDALQEVHSMNIWHLDLKPANIMIDRKGTVKLIDFGASKQSAPDGLSSSGVACTRGFAPEEQMEGNKDKFGPWTDFYALGATLFNLLTNTKPPMPSDIKEDETPDKSLTLPMPRVSKKMRELVLKLMKNNRKQRPQSVSEILEYLDGDVDGNGNGNGDDDGNGNGDGNGDGGDTETLDVGSKLNKTLLWVCASAMLAGGGIGWIASNHVAQPVEEVFVDSTEAVEVMDTSLVEDEVPAAPTVLTVSNQKMTIPEGECFYTGEVNDDGLPEGKGKASFTNGDVCQGTFVNGQIDGDDINYHFKDGDVFTGSIKNGMLIKGKYTDHKTNSYFLGSFEDNQPSVGKWYDKNGKLIKSIGNSN